MRRIARLDLPATAQKDMDRRQEAADRQNAKGDPDIEGVWKSARQSKTLRTVLSVLQQMAGFRERCMYCGDSHGADIDHFWPKRKHPGRMFRWPNLLLCCTECGRLKGDGFPIEGDSPLLIDPTVEDPWRFLDFDPGTGNLVARFDPAANDWTRKGTATVAALHLDRREALSAGYQKTHRRLKSLVDEALQSPPIDAAVLAGRLREADDHGLLGWCFNGTGRNVAPFADLRVRYPAVWQACVGAFA